MKKLLSYILFFFYFCDKSIYDFVFVVILDTDVLVPDWNEVVWTDGDYGGVDEDARDGRGDITADEEVDYSQDWF